MQYELFNTEAEAKDYNALVQEAINTQCGGFINKSRYFVNAFPIFDGRWAVPVPDEISIEPQGERIQDYPKPEPEEEPEEPG
jgi:hypothetical protein